MDIIGYIHNTIHVDTSLSPVEYDTYYQILLKSATNEISN